MDGYRMFQGKETRQVDGHSGHQAEAEAWYYEPDDYAGDVLYSLPFPTRDAAEAAAQAEPDDEATV